VTFELETRGKGRLLVITHRRIATAKTKVGVRRRLDAHIGILSDRLNGRRAAALLTTHAKLKREYEAKL